MLKASR
jgi:uncharacterized protein YjbI with pentapeptide repeats